MKRDAFAFDGAGERQRGAGEGRAQRGVDLLEVVAVDLAHVEAKRRPLLDERLEVEHVLGAAKALKAVGVDDRR